MTADFKLPKGLNRIIQTPRKRTEPFFSLTLTSFIAAHVFNYLTDFTLHLTKFTKSKLK